MSLHVPHVYPVVVGWSCPEEDRQLALYSSVEILPQGVLKVPIRYGFQAILRKYISMLCLFLWHVVITRFTNQVSQCHGFTLQILI